MRKVIYAISVFIVLVTVKATFKIGFNPAPEPAIASTESLLLKAENPFTRANDTVQLSLLSGWQSSINPKDPKHRLLAAKNPNKGLYLMTFTYPKEAQTVKNLEQAAELSNKGANTLDHARTEKMPLQKVGSYRAAQHKIIGTTRTSKVETVFLMTTIEAPNAYHIILMNAPATTFSAHQMELQLAIQSFQETTQSTAPQSSSK